MPAKFAKVAVDNAALCFDKLFDYSVAPSLKPNIQVGTRVLVPFGNGSKLREGVVFALSDQCEYDKVKPIVDVLDEEVFLSPEQVDLAVYLRETTFCTYYDAVRVLTPAGLHYKVKREVSLTPLYQQHAQGLSGDEERIVAYLLQKRKPQPVEGILKEMGLKKDSCIKALLEKGVLEISQSVKRRALDQTRTIVRKAPEKALPKLTEKQNAVLEVIEQVGQASIKDLTQFCSVGQSVVDALVKKGVLEKYELPILRTPQVQLDPELYNGQIALSCGQQKVLQGLLDLLFGRRAACALLHGVTGSGKTLVYLKLIEQVLAMGRTVMVMVPEIALTPQVVSLFRARFGQRVAIMHSALSMGERLDEYKRIRAGKVDIVVGTRSAVFCPLENIGLIVMDEEQESTYKSDMAPRYHARDVAKYRCVRHQALLLLVSATPSVESYYMAQQGRYHLFELKERYSKRPLPQVQIIDMKQSERGGNYTVFSDTLLEEISQNLARNEQSILLLNRRGYHTQMTCQECGTVVCCPNCSIALTYHQNIHRMMCHYCGFSMGENTPCKVCNSRLIQFAGTGTQKAQEELSALFPKARILRMDLDTTMSRYSYENYLSQFGKGEYDILLGTQMIAKGLDFENVTLVGVLNADQALYAPDFRSYERTFSLLTQVVGRSGRGDKAGRALIQTHDPNHEVIRLAAKQDYKGFYEQEILMRKANVYPPFCDICIVGFVGENASLSGKTAGDFAMHLQTLVKQKYTALPLVVLGPAQSGIFRMGGKYRYKLLIKCKQNKTFRSFLHEAMDTFEPPSAVRIFAEMNYESI